jgi:lipopolysaccharide biosynthesis regulator YciM
MLELLFLLLPVAAGYGWIMGRNSNKQKEFKSKASLSQEYSAGLNFLLSDQEEKAVEHLIEFLEVNADTLETHLTLANLFRKRGEFDKALEIHEHLNNLELDLACSNKIKLELANDYISAGMLDRAESTLLSIELADDNKDTILQMLVNIYQTLKDWQKSDDLCASHKNLNCRLKCTLSHHCCELAEETLDNDSVVNWYKKALRYDSKCVRALLALADRSVKQHNYVDGIADYQKVISVDPGYTPLLIDKIEQCFMSNNDKAGFYHYLQSAMKQSMEQSPGKVCVSFSVKYSVYMEHYEGAGKALDFILNCLEQKPNIRAFVQLLDLESKNTDSQQAAKQFIKVKALVSQYLDSKPLYDCRHCGFATKQHYWLCPSCQTWGNSKPAMGLDGL